MLFSKVFIPTLREDPHSAECKSHTLLLRGGFLSMISSGIYAYLPLGVRVLNKISNVIRTHMNSKEASELLMTVLQPLEMWEKTGRIKDMEEVMLRVRDRKDRDLCLGPTHEEEITEIAKKYIASYKQLPVVLYQIQTKFRDETRPRYGLVRSCEFIMKDAYSFDRDQEGLAANYEKMLDAYQNIFSDCGLDFITVEADSGVMGGSVSHEFLVPAEIGEDILYYCQSCQKYFREDAPCPQCQGATTQNRMIEVGHIFQLGTKYSEAQGAYFLDNDGVRKPVIMGCYGIGVSRLLSAVVEQNFDEKGIVWPHRIAPFMVSVVVVGIENEELLAAATELIRRLESAGIEVLLDDRDHPAGVKFKDAYLLGIPYIAIFGKKYLETKKIEIEVRKTSQKIALGSDECIEFLKNHIDAYQKL
ncbi:MAG: proline--tRNA ligase [Candidatus Omnitrophica bacterium]|nr:proline--tRNA ligase [Candidatus Omnitrophota bacterium]